MNDNFKRLKLHAHGLQYSWQMRNGDTLANVSQKKMYEIYGERNWNLIRRELIADGTMTLVRDYQFFQPNPDGTKKRGVCKGYRIAPLPDKAEVIDIYSNPTKAITTFEKEYIATHNRTNMTSAPVVVLGNPEKGDTRNYTPYTSLPKTERDKITIDGDQTIEPDFAGCFPFAVGATLPAHMKKKKRNQEFIEMTRKGTFYDNVAFVAGTSRGVAKTTWARALNTKSRNLRLNDEERLVWRAIKMMFPDVAKFIRECGRAGVSFGMCVGFEGAIRKLILKKTKKLLGYQALDSHDGFRIKIKDLDAFHTIMLQIGSGMPYKVVGANGQALLFTNSSSLLPLVLQDTKNDSKNTNNFFDFGDSC